MAKENDNEESTETNKGDNQYVDKKTNRYINRDDDDEVLWERFKEDFEGWDKERFNQVTKSYARKLRYTLYKRGVWFPMDNNLSLSRELFDNL